jgi:hypothetical protein
MNNKSLHRTSLIVAEPVERPTAKKQCSKSLLFYHILGGCFAGHPLFCYKNKKYKEYTNYMKNQIYNQEPIASQHSGPKDKGGRCRFLIGSVLSPSMDILTSSF